MSGQRPRDKQPRGPELSDQHPRANRASGYRLERAEQADLSAVQRLELEAGVRFAEIGMTEIAEAEPSDTATLTAAIDEQRLIVAVDETDETRTAEGPGHRQGDDPTSDRVLAGYLQWSTTDGVTHIDQVSVHPRAAGNRLGQGLIDHACEVARGRGDDRVTLTTFAAVPWNGPLYERYGFVPLTVADQGPELRAIRTDERAAGLDAEPRIAMYRDIRPR